MNELNKEFSENPNRREEEEEEERREKEEGRRRKKTNNNRKKAKWSHRKKEMVTLFTRLLLQCSNAQLASHVCYLFPLLFNNYFFPSLLLSSDFDFSYIV
jgi:hypothetical protein